MDIEREIFEIKERNKRVEVDKAWERSWVRRISIMIMTYVVAVTWLGIISESNLWLKAFVPVAGYFLSTLSLAQIKQLWSK